MKKAAIILMVGLAMAGCEKKQSADVKDTKTANAQQEQYSKAQPIPMFDWSLERQLVIDLYQVRNQKAATHSVPRSAS